MPNFAESFSNFLTELKNNILYEMAEGNHIYEELKAENESRLSQLQSLVPPALLDNYVETQYAIASFEIEYCYLCGMRDRKKQDKLNPTGEKFSQELNTYETYRQLQNKATMQYNELIAKISSEDCVTLIQYIKCWNTILELEKHYCYSGGIHVKAMLDEQLNLSDESAWESLTDLFL